MKIKRHIFVTSATGNQGSAVTRHLLDQGHKVIGLTRDANSEKAQQLKSQGVIIVEGNLNEYSFWSIKTNRNKTEIKTSN